MQTFSFSDLPQADLCVDAAYEGGRVGNAGDDRLPRLLIVSNQGAVSTGLALDNSAPAGDASAPNAPEI